MPEPSDTRRQLETTGARDGTNSDERKKRLLQGASMYPQPNTFPNGLVCVRKLRLVATANYLELPLVKATAPIAVVVGIPSAPVSESFPRRRRVNAPSTIDLGNEHRPDTCDRGTRTSRYKQRGVKRG